ncbi:Glyoxylase, beta-lactamase superfamily II [Mucilaginibacter pineti]|uniref:Glyoxylase, beta-lactamase superfamily II n=1 Tax=Mucilaginibacter pineti TaxID=1391627 RepID=A0A1G6Z3J9_9SPHI|nr:rhodanese-like domain-containing protein [Mucilaginibacter pineti]SDD97111.1 Glyoxylase, beta-lactamase superfamily II [Mucilaginibacter pineti]
MKVHRFENVNLAYYSYAILSELTNEIILIDPERNIEDYTKYAIGNAARITAVILTHAHENFTGGHLELQEFTGAFLYCSRHTQATYQHRTFDEGDEIRIGEITLRALNTPGHSPDSICILLICSGKAEAVFTGDTLLIGDCGRPVLTGIDAGVCTDEMERLGSQLYRSLRECLMVLDPEILIYPAHRAYWSDEEVLNEEEKRTIGTEMESNWSLRDKNEADFVRNLLAKQNVQPKYFPYNVWLNKRGAETLLVSVGKVNIGRRPFIFDVDVAIIDTRPRDIFNRGHLPGAINIQDGPRFERSLGSVLSPDELYYLVAEDEHKINTLIKRAANIGYEVFIDMAFTSQSGVIVTALLDLEHFKSNSGFYSIIDLRNSVEARSKTIFPDAINIPLHQLRERIAEIPDDKPLVVHCSDGYRSAIGSSILTGQDHLQKVYDLGPEVGMFMHNNIRVSSY